MTTLEVIEGLKQTGTGEAKLDLMRRHVEHNPGLEKDDFCDWVRQEISPVTAQKARHLAAGRDVKELLGTPPPRSEEKKAMDVVGAIQGLAQTILEDKKQTRQDEANALGIGMPRKPAKGKDE